VETNIYVLFANEGKEESDERAVVTITAAHSVLQEKGITVFSSYGVVCGKVTFADGIRARYAGV